MSFTLLRNMRKSSSVPKEMGRTLTSLPSLKSRVSVETRSRDIEPMARQKSNRGSDFDYLKQARRSVFDDFEEYLQRNDQTDEREMKDRATTIKFFYKRAQFDPLTGLNSNKITDNDQEKMRMKKIREDTKPISKNTSVEQISQARKNLDRNLNMQRTPGSGKIFTNELWSQNYQRRIMKYSHVQDLVDRVEKKRIRDKLRTIYSTKNNEKSRIEDIINELRVKKIGKPQR